MKIRSFAAALSLTLLVAPTLVAQQPAAAPPPDHATLVKQAFQKSAVAIRQYQWIETTALSLKGEEKSRTQASCYYGADGKVQKTPLAAPPAEDKKRGLRGKVAENKKEEISESMKAAVALVHQYVPLDPARIDAAKAAGKLSVTPPDPKANVVVVIKDYLKAGDSVTINLNAATNLVTGLTVASYLADAKDAVGLKVAFATLADGTLYAAMSNLAVASQNLAVSIENTGYKKAGS
jgi:hypothetical protein